MARKTYMTEATIQKMEHQSAEQVASTFSDVQAAAVQFLLLLRSYRIAANVAVSAWKLVEELQHTGQISAAAVEELKQRLHLFAPQAPAFTPPKPMEEYAARLLETLYDRLSAFDSPTFNASAVLNALFDYILELRKEAAR